MVSKDSSLSTGTIDGIERFLMETGTLSIKVSNSSLSGFGTVPIVSQKRILKSVGFQELSVSEDSSLSNWNYPIVSKILVSVDWNYRWYRRF
ncbi:hypothetical protein AVEN_181354-1 [Araneus ventricosus]|uniref:Uncharacterized protein n=1 Tax=Araneus ventricosus TaxID=182803 RepID=A0A4Y2T0X9_ARAVE|nr:hypothetical protein AVEN_181354-1 [Araneus ventricosus]